MTHPSLRTSRRRGPSLVAVALALAAIAGSPSAARAQAQSPGATGASADPAPAAPTARASTPELYVPGLALFGAVYFAGIPLSSALASAEGSKFGSTHAGIMAIPFAGPWLEAAGVFEIETRNAAPWLATAGVLQVVGAGLTVVGLALRRDVPATRVSQPAWLVAPLGPTSAGAGGWGLVVAGRM